MVFQSKSVTVTADIGRILGLSLLVVLLLSEVDNKTVFVGMSLVSNKEGVYLANEIMDILTSDRHLKLNKDDVKGKVSGMAGDGAFCKENAPFKNRMKELFGGDFKFKWDLLHLLNRAHIEALAKQAATQFNLNTVLDFIQNHSKKYRSGLDYTKLRIEQLFDFRRPKVKSDTRLVNYESI